MSTSMKGNDHVTKSRFIQEAVHEWAGRTGQTDATCIATALEALTEATLAVAHEQRMNTLALLASSEVLPTATAEESVTATLREGLGL